MSSINKVMLIGRLGRDPEVRYLESGTAVAKFSIATSENYKDKEGNWQELTEWHDIVMWRNLAERAEQQLSKGRLIYVEGKLTHRKWVDQEGNNRKTTEVVAQLFRTLEKKDASSNYFPSEENEIPAKTTSKAPVDVMNSDSDEEPSDDLPF